MPRPLPTSGFSAGRALKTVCKGRKVRPFPANSAKAEAARWQEELDGIETELKSPTLRFDHGLRLEARKTVLQHLIATSGR